LAASVAVLAVIAGPGFFHSDPQIQPLRLADNPAPRLRDEVGGRPAELSVFYVDHTGTHWSLERPDVELKLNDYLLNHQQYAPSSGVKATPSFATFVSYDARR